MSLNIKNPETESLVRQLVAESGENVTRAVTVAVQERLDRLRGEDTGATERRVSRLREISDDARRRWTEPYRSGAHGDLLYDEVGLPR